MRKTLRSLVGVALALSLTGGVATTAAAEEGASARKAKVVRKIHIVARDYQFKGVRKRYHPGTKVFTFKNRGTEPHEAIIFRLLHGKTVKQLLNMPEKKAMKHIEFKAALFAEPGERGKRVRTNLRRGRYAMLCFVGSPEHEMPHFAMGMIHKFKVRR